MIRSCTTRFLRAFSAGRTRLLCTQQLVVTEPGLKQVFSSIINSSKPPHEAQCSYLNQLSQALLVNYPASATAAWGEPLLVVRLMELEKCGHREVEGLARLCLALLGKPPAYPGRGLRILSIDGGGTRGLVPLTILKHLEEVCGEPVHAMFDLVCGTSTGSLLASLLCLEKLSTQQAMKVYLTLSHEVFKMNNLKGVSHLFLNHAFYDSKLLQNHVRQFQSVNQPLYMTSGHPAVPRLCFVSTVANQSVVVPYLFCNYQHRPCNDGSSGGGGGGGGGGSHYQQRCDVQCWEAIMASTAAPGFFKEVKLGSGVFMDGGILTNNPCGVAIHEARVLWGSGVPIQTVVSLGTGLPHGGEEGVACSSTSLKDKVFKVVGGATDTETVHSILKDVYSPSVYFRFQPKLSEDISIDESNLDKLHLLCQDAEQFILEHRDVLEAAASSLKRKKRPHQMMQNWFQGHWDKLSHVVQSSSRQFRRKL